MFHAAYDAPRAGDADDGATGQPALEVVAPAGTTAGIIPRHVPWHRLPSAAAVRAT